MSANNTQTPDTQTPDTQTPAVQQFDDDELSTTTPPSSYSQLWNQYVKDLYR